MRAGMLRDRVVIEKLQTVNRGPLGRQAEWVEEARRWCRIMPVRSQEMAEWASLQFEVSVRLEFRFDALVEGIIPDERRVRKGSRVFLPRLPARDPDERRRRIHVLCSEEVEREAAS